MTTKLSVEETRNHMTTVPGWQLWGSAIAASPAAKHAVAKAESHAEALAEAKKG